jgi:hypothetical protein
MKGLWDFKYDVHGASVLLSGYPVTPGALSDAEVDYQIDRLKNDLDQVGKKMKREIAKRRNERLEIKTAP